MTNNALTIWVLCLTIFIAIQSFGDLQRWSRLGATMKTFGQSFDSVTEALRSQAEFNERTTSLMAKVVANQRAAAAEGPSSPEGVNSK